MLFHVYDEPKPEGYYVNEPFGIYRDLLDADWLLWILLPLLLGVVVVGLMYAWHLHEIPTHKADKKKMRQAELVSALTLLGLFEHWVWAVALFIAFMDWDAAEDWVVNILRRSRVLEPVGPAAVAVAITPAVAVADAGNVATPVAEALAPTPAEAVPSAKPDDEGVKA